MPHMIGRWGIGHATRQWYKKWGQTAILKLNRYHFFGSFVKKATMDDLLFLDLTTKTTSYSRQTYHFL